MKGPVALIILDGFGLRDTVEGNAVAQAHKPNFDRYHAAFPTTTLQASGEAVGLPDGQMGNSEVGHTNIGAGRIVYQSLTRITKSIHDGDFFEKEPLIAALQQAKKENQALHVMGLLSDGGVHSHYEHLFALLRMAKEHDVKNVYVHGFLDGRDVGPTTASTYIQETERQMKEIGVGEFASISGRYYALDRDKRWERTQLTYDAMVYGKGPRFQTAEEGLQASYAQEVVDEFVVPFVIEKENEPVATVNDGDAVVFFNFRPDRAIQLSRAFTEVDFNGFLLGEKTFEQLYFASFTHYSEEVRSNVVFAKENLVNTFGEVVSNEGLRQLRIAETEKYPHVTFFFNGGKEDEFALEQRILIHSPKVATYDLQPEMSAFEVTEALLEEIKHERQDVIILNFANPDMVGHSGLLQPTIDAIEAVDQCLGQIVDALLEKDGVALITADHGNADEVITVEGHPMTAHTTNPVPLIVTKKGIHLRSDGILADLTPTMLDLLNIKKPAEMTGQSLIEGENETCQ